MSLTELEGRYHTLALGIGQSWSGSVRNFFLRAPQVFIEVRTDDGRTARYRVIPEMAREEFLLNPLCDSQQELLDLYTDPPTRSRRTVLSFILSTQGSSRAFDPTIEVTIRSYANLTKEMGTLSFFQKGSSLGMGLSPMPRLDPFSPFSGSHAPRLPVESSDTELCGI